MQVHSSLSFAVLLGCLLTLVFAQPARATTLDDIRSDVQGDGDSSGDSGDDSDGDSSGSDSRGKKTATTTHSPTYDSSDYDDEPDLAEEFIGWLFLQLIIAPFTGPYAVLDDNWAREDAFADYPYADGHPGYILAGRTRSAGGAEFSAQPWVAAGMYLEGTAKYSGGIRIQSPWRLDLDANFSTLGKLQDGLIVDSLDFADVGVLFRFAQSDNAQWRVGLQAQWMRDGDRRDGGAALVYGFDLFPSDPIVLSTRFSIGPIGGTWNLRAQQSLGITVGLLEFFAALDYQGIGQTKILGLSGGLRLWI